MTRSSLSTWNVVCCLIAAFGLHGCTSDTSAPQGETGALSLNLELGDTNINEVRWVISRPGMEDMDGVINTSAPGATASVEVFGLPPGAGYLVTLSALAADEETLCVGSENFAIEIGEVEQVTVYLRCKAPERFGSVRVNGEFNQCAYLHKVVVSPLEIGVGYDIDVSAIAKDEEGDDIEYRWSNDLGGFGDPTAQVTTYTCGEVGTHEITITITDDGEPCEDSWTVSVECVDVDGVECTDDMECDDQNDCTQDLCTAGSCLNPDEDAGVSCDQDGGAVCDGDGNCVECNENADCDQGEICVANECRSDPDLFCDTGICVDDAAARADCVETFLVCIVDNPDDEECIALSLLECNECNQDSDCDEGFVCDDDNECVEVEYAQDFNQLDITGEFIGDGWAYFVNVFATIPYDYGGAAPNGPQICALVDDQGGAEQEPQQLSVYSDYNNADHGNGFLIETNVFQEPFDFNNRIPASEVGKTYTFTFEAKAGNIAGSSTANAFIKTLDPDAGFAESSADRVDTTSLPDTWGGFTLSLEITSDVVGHLLQFGFQSNATNFESSGNFYDNVLVTK